jgi:SSS family solute:Na+ symporter
VPSLGVLSGMIAVFLTYKVWKIPAVHALRLLGNRHRPARGLYLPRLGIKDDEETIKRQAEVRAFLDDIDEPSEPGKSGAAP